MSRYVLVLLATMSVALAADAAVPIAEGVSLIPGSFVPGTQPDGNTVVFSGPEGLVVVDTGRHPEHTRQILAFAAEAGRPVRAVINTHWHLDHTGGNVLLRREVPGLRIIASGAIREALTGFLATYREQLAAAAAEPSLDPATREAYRQEMALIDAGPALAPDDVVTSSGVRTLAGRVLELHLETRAVTAGDLWILDPATRVLVSGDLVTLPVPLLDTACPTGWQKALSALAATNFTVLVPGHGPPLDREQVARYRSVFDGLLACASSDAPAQECIDGWVTAAGDLIPETDRALARRLLQYYLDQVLRGDPARTAKLCGG
jgi:glyoxylase-like metal-dependent hydrolase (beta-lactamase superfamily II)